MDPSAFFKNSSKIGVLPALFVIIRFPFFPIRSLTKFKVDHLIKTNSQFSTYSNFNRFFLLSPLPPPSMPIPLTAPTSAGNSKKRRHRSSTVSAQPSVATTRSRSSCRSVEKCLLLFCITIKWDLILIIKVREEISVKQKRFSISNFSKKSV